MGLFTTPVHGVRSRRVSSPGSEVKLPPIETPTGSWAPSRAGFLHLLSLGHVDDDDAPADELDDPYYGSGGAGSRSGAPLSAGAGGAAPRWSPRLPPMKEESRAAAAAVSALNSDGQHGSRMMMFGGRTGGPFRRESTRTTASWFSGDRRRGRGSSRAASESPRDLLKTPTGPGDHGWGFDGPASSVFSPPSDFGQVEEEDRHGPMARSLSSLDPFGGIPRWTSGLHRSSTMGDLNLPVTKPRTDPDSGVVDGDEALSSAIMPSVFVEEVPSSGTPAFGFRLDQRSPSQRELERFGSTGSLRGRSRSRADSDRSPHRLSQSPVMRASIDLSAIRDAYLDSVITLAARTVADDSEVAACAAIPPAEMATRPIAEALRCLYLLGEYIGVLREADMPFAMVQATRPYSIELGVHVGVWYLFSREVRQSLLGRMLVEGCLEGGAADPRIAGATMLPASKLTNIYGLSGPHDDRLFNAAAQWELYQNDFYLPGGAGFMRQLRTLEGQMVDHIKLVHSVLGMTFNVYQYSTAIYITKLANSPVLELASRLPDADPPIALARVAQGVFDIERGDLYNLMSSARSVWPAGKDLVTKGIFGVDCLVLQLLIKSRWPVAAGESVDDPATLLPHALQVTKDHFAACLDQAGEVDLVALPMMIFHLLSHKVLSNSQFQPESLTVLMLVAEWNVNFAVLSRAARLRAAASIQPPAWWTLFRSGKVVIHNMYASQAIKPDSSAEFEALVTEPFGPGHVARFRALKATGWKAKSQVAAAMGAALEMLVKSIEDDGDWITPEPWIWIANLYAKEFNQHVSGTLVSDSLPARLRALLSVLTPQVDIRLDVSADVNLLFTPTRLYAEARLSVCASNNAEGAPALAQGILQRMLDTIAL